MKGVMKIFLWLWRFIILLGYIWMIFFLVEEDPLVWWVDVIIAIFVGSLALGLGGFHDPSEKEKDWTNYDDPVPPPEVILAKNKGRDDFWRMIPLGCGCGGWVVGIIIIIAIVIAIVYNLLQGPPPPY